MEPVSQGVSGDNAVGGRKTDMFGRTDGWRRHGRATVGRAGADTRAIIGEEVGRYNVLVQCWLAQLWARKREEGVWCMG